MVDTTDPRVDPASAGLQALAEGRWAEARTALGEALDDRETPELLEGLSWAAWWLDDAAAVFDARERAYRLYRQGGNPASAARMAIWLAIDHLDFHGATAVASGWLGLAARLLEPLHLAGEHGWLAFQEGYLAHLAGDTRTARDRARAAAEIGRRFGIADLEMLGLALEGGTLVASADIAAGMRCLDEASATALAGESTVPISTAWALCFLVTASLDVRDYRRAVEWSDRIAEFATRHDSRYMLGFCRSHYGAVHLVRGRWADAETELTAAVVAYERSRPAMAGDPLVWLAELRRRQGRGQEATELLDRAGDSAAAHACRGRLALDRGEGLSAIELARRCLRQIPIERHVERWPALELLVRAASMHGAIDEAETALAELRELVELIQTVPLRASAAHAEGIVAAVRAEHDRARRHFEDAADAYERVGAAFEVLTTRLDLAQSVLALGRTDNAEHEIRRALAGLEALGANHEAARARGLLGLPPDGDGRRAVGPITSRERDVLGLLAEGLTNRQIAERLVLSEHTVHRHVANILRKLDLPSRAAAAAYAAGSGLLDNVGSARG